MLFQTVEFAILILVVLLGIGAVRQRERQHALLLVASYVFYGWWDVRFLILLLLSSVIDYSVALGIRGRRLSNRELARMSALVLGAGLVFLGPDWPALQSGAGLGLGPARWQGAGAALGLVAAFALAGPLLYAACFRLPERARRRAFLLTSVASNLGILGFFKYFDFFRGNLVGLGHWLGADVALPALDVALPVGISFYTFQTLSYTIDVYRGRIQPEPSLARLALYVAYFPQLVAGPILRPAQFLPALAQAWTLRAPQLTSGFNLALVGLAKKVLIADRVGPLADVILDDPVGRSSVVVIYGAALFAVQIYCDFSGYTDIARGVSRIFGVEIPLNFDFPYFSRSITEFWRRWHISLSTWLRDYLYISLGGNRRGISRTYANLMTTMVLGGLWHGAAWNFVIWGAYQGALLCANRWLADRVARSATASRWLGSRVGAVLSWAITLYLTLLGWLIFRISDPSELLAAVRSFVVFDFRTDVAGTSLGLAAPFSATLAFLAFAALHATGRFWQRWPAALDETPPSRLFALYVLMGIAFFLLWPAGERPFIYFQF
jgi:D-alanyl-lipoteichoic acid acyltransferase DltB (MBOAT superfamily)